MKRIHRILVPVDFSTLSIAALQYGNDLAAQCGADLHVLHVLTEQISSVPAFEFGLALPTNVKENRAAAEQQLAALIDSSWERDRKIVTVVVDGSPLEDIVRYARTHQIDLIVLSSHGRTGLSHLLMGSVAEKVVRMSPCPVLTIRPADDKATG